jgi:hypothetical protein
MDWLTFVTKIIEAIAWPTVAIVALLVFRKSIIRLVPMLRRLKTKILEVEFGEDLKRIELDADAAGLPPPDEKQLLAQKSRIERIKSDRAWGPVAAIVEAWTGIEFLVTDLYALRNKKPPQQYMELLRFVEELRGADEIDDDSFRVFRELRDLRNKSVHSKPGAISAWQAQEYILLANRLANLFRQLLDKRSD